MAEDLRSRAANEKETLFSRQKNGGFNSQLANTLVSAKTILPASQVITEEPRTSQSLPNILLVMLIHSLETFQVELFK